MDSITPRPRPVWIGGHAEQGEHTRVVTHPYDGTEVATVAIPGLNQVEQAIVSTQQVARELRSTPVRARTSALERVARGLSARAAETAEMITAESGKPLCWAEAEVADATATLRTAARLAGETRRLECDLAEETRTSLVHRVPCGTVLATVPYATPLLITARAFAAALAVGAPVVVAPSPSAPMSALGLGELLANTDLPGGTFSVLPIDDSSNLAHDRRLMTMPGDDQGDVTAVVLKDWTDLDRAAERLATAGTGQAGQSPVAVRRVIVEDEIATDFIPRLTEAVRSQQTGDPYDSDISVGPMVDQAAAERILTWVEDLVAGGAQLLTGGTRTGTVVEPTLLTDVTVAETDSGGVVPGPVLTVSVVSSAEEAFTAAAGHRTGVFTRDVELALSVSEKIDSNEVVVGDVPSYRPENIRTTMRSLTEERLIVLPGTAG